jgi:hypothetical protein
MFKYICNQCGFRFDRPYIEYDFAGDEQYDVTPCSCKTDDYTENPHFGGAEPSAIPSQVTDLTNQKSTL